MQTPLKKNLVSVFGHIHQEPDVYFPERTTFFFTRHHRIQLKYKSKILKTFRIHTTRAWPVNTDNALLQNTSRNVIFREMSGSSSGSLQALLFTRKQTSWKTFSPLSRNNLFTHGHRESEKRPYFHGWEQCDHSSHKLSQIGWRERSKEPVDSRQQSSNGYKGNNFLPPARRLEFQHTLLL